MDSEKIVIVLRTHEYLLKLLAWFRETRVTHAFTGLESAILQLYQHRASEMDHSMENIVCDLLLSTCKAETDFCSCIGQAEIH